jgi:hypothetical protein
MAAHLRESENNKGVSGPVHGKLPGDPAGGWD